ncbi:MAG TPA: RhuM family protein [Candidatus Omnitrophota bacterium]|nr:RhuM family protein [Candidatus Omnitrophota bacterium]HPD85600.1 RhuM family protein [Candidatus Omnitrophota bacterium]HRZ04528.1 RhuM family protein [Candidatus Omnitrophota bacterium]
MTNKEIPSRGEIIIYQAKDKKVRLEVSLQQETVWLTQKQISDLFKAERSVVTKHLRNIFSSRELDKTSVCAKIAHTAADGKVYQTTFYNLDVVISIGYRINSSRATQFRIWATNVLRKHLVDGYTLNEKRLKLAQHKYQQLQKSLKLLDNVMQLEGVSDQTKGLIQVISEYSRALDLLDDFDHEKLELPKGTKRVKYTLTYDRAIEIIRQMRQKFHDSQLMGQEKDESFKSSIGAIYQTFGKKDVYPTVEEKAAHLLYFVTKNHNFVDGNKRIAAALFISFLQGNGLLLRKNGAKRIDDNALVALTLMIAASRPGEKEIMVKVILNLLAS